MTEQEFITSVTRQGDQNIDNRVLRALFCVITELQNIMVAIKENNAIIKQREQCEPDQLRLREKRKRDQ